MFENKTTGDAFQFVNYYQDHKKQRQVADLLQSLYSNLDKEQHKLQHNPAFSNKKEKQTIIHSIMSSHLNGM